MSRRRGLVAEIQRDRERQRAQAEGAAREAVREADRRKREAMRSAAAHDREAMRRYTEERGREAEQLNVRWAGQWSEAQIAAGRDRDRLDLERYLSGATTPSEPENPPATAPPSLLARIWQRLRGHHNHPDA